MIRNLTPWTLLTRNGVPPLKVARRALVVGGVTVEVGETLDPELFAPAIRRMRLRQFYEQRLLEPVDPQPNTRQYYRERFARMQGLEPPVAPITPVAACIVADLPAVEVGEEDSPRPKPRKR